MIESKINRFAVYMLLLVVLYFVTLFLINSTGLSGRFTIITPEYYDFDKLPTNINVRINENVLIDIENQGSGYLFSDNTGLFDIDPNTGLISWKPDKQGVFPVALIAMRSNSEVKVKLVLFNVRI